MDKTSGTHSSTKYYEKKSNEVSKKDKLGMLKNALYSCYFNTMIILKSMYWACTISYRKYILQITQTSQYKYTKLQYRFAVISGAPSSRV